MAIQSNASTEEVVGGIKTYSGLTNVNVTAVNHSSTNYYMYCNFGRGYFGTTAVSSGNQDDAGVGTFEHDVPAGFYAICTKNIKDYG